MLHVLKGLAHTLQVKEEAGDNFAQHPDVLLGEVAVAKRMGVRFLAHKDIPSNLFGTRKPGCLADGRGGGDALLHYPGYSKDCATLKKLLVSAFGEYLGMETTRFLPGRQPDAKIDSLTAYVVARKNRPNKRNQLMPLAPSWASYPARQPPVRRRRRRRPRRRRRSRGASCRRRRRHCRRRAPPPWP